MANEKQNYDKTVMTKHEKKYEHSKSDALISQILTDVKKKIPNKFVQICGVGDHQNTRRSSSSIYVYFVDI